MLNRYAIVLPEKFTVNEVLAAITLAYGLRMEDPVDWDVEDLTDAVFYTQSNLGIGSCYDEVECRVKEFLTQENDNVRIFTLEATNVFSKEVYSLIIDIISFVREKHGAAITSTREY